MQDASPHDTPLEPVLVDARGHRCPIPVLMMERALRRLPAGASLKVIADDPIAAIDIPHFARAAGREARRLPDIGGACVFLVTAGGNPPPAHGGRKTEAEGRRLPSKTGEG